MDEQNTGANSLWKMTEKISFCKCKKDFPVLVNFLFILTGSFPHLALICLVNWLFHLALAESLIYKFVRAGFNEKLSVVCHNVTILEIILKPRSICLPKNRGHYIFYSNFGERGAVLYPCSPFISKTHKLTFKNSAIKMSLLL